MFAQELLHENADIAKVVCLEGELGAGKTTFTQGMLKGLKIEGPYTSPTFVIMKEYKILKAKSDKLKAVCHIDAYRVGADDVLALDWKEMISHNNIVIAEWAERIKKIIPKDAIWIKFKWIDKDKREINFQALPRKK